MGRCVHCQRVKGKRSCPVLGGMICSLCCGQHRLKTIACPSDCQYLGGLALVDEAQPISDFPRGALDEVVQGMAVYLRSGAEHRATHEAIARFFGEDGDPHDADEWAQGLCLGYLHYGHRDCSGRRLVDRFAEQRGRDLGREAALAVRSLRSCWASLFEVEAVYRGAGIDLRDMLSEEAIKVSEVSGTYHIRSGETLFAWLMPVGDRIEMVGVSVIVPMEARARLLGELRATRAGSRDRGGDAPLVYRLLSDAIAHAPLPKLANTDGEDLVFCKAHYEVLDADAAREALGVVPGFEADGDSFHWIGPSKMRGPDATVSLGRVDLDGAALVLETNSRERLERGKRLLGEHAGRWIEHRADSIQSTESLLREAPRAPRDRPPRDEVPPEVQAEVVGQFLRDHYATWPDVPLPALGGKTPRQAAQTKRGRAKVRALVDDIEQGTLRQPGGETVDFGTLRRALGLDEESADGDYDAARSPGAREWLALDEAERLAAIESYHRSLAVHPPMPNPRMHAMVHLIVENQIALGHPAAVGEALERLGRAGLSRHEAVHAIGAVVAEGMWEVIREQQGLDRDELSRKLRRLEPGEHRGTAP